MYEGGRPLLAPLRPLVQWASVLHLGRGVVFILGRVDVMREAALGRDKKFVLRGWRRFDILKTSGRP